MIPPFGLHLPRIIFGPGRLGELGELVLRFGRKPLLVLGGASFRASEPCQALLTDLQKLSISPQIVHIHSEPSPELIDGIVADRTITGRDLVIAIGGGSVLDSGKALAAMLVEQVPVTRFLEGVGKEKPSGLKLPFIAVPTTAGTGSEATCNAVISSVGEKGFKRSLRHSRYMPELALIDPKLTLTCPRPLTVACAMDCFTQLVEGYLSIKGSPLTETLALDGIRAVCRSLEVVGRDGANLAARCDLAYGTMLSGVVLTNAGLGTVHGFASAIGGFFTVPHGVVCGVLMAATNRVTLTSLRRSGKNPAALKKYATLGQLFSGTAGKSDSWLQDHCIAELERLTEELALPRLAAFGICRSDIPKIVEQTANKYNPAPLAPEELAEILSGVLDD